MTEDDQSNVNQVGAIIHDDDDATTNTDNKKAMLQNVGVREQKETPQQEIQKRKATTKSKKREK